MVRAARSPIVPLAVLAVILLGGCRAVIGPDEQWKFARSGRIFSHIVEPLDTDMDVSRVRSEGELHGTGTVQHVEYDGVSVKWNSNAIAEIARRNGIVHVQHVDLETTTVLGIWMTYTVHVWGTAD